MAGYRLQRTLTAITAIAGIGFAGIGLAAIGLPGVAAAQSVGARDAALVAEINAAYGTQFPVPAPAAPAMIEVTPARAGGTDG